jgi:L-threonine kinase
MSDILATATMPATLGEWVQGWIDGRESLVSLVVTWSGSVELSALRSGDVFHTPGEKVQRAFSTAKKHFQSDKNIFPEDSFINVINPHPIARGLATSTMDIAGTFAACAAFAERCLSDEELFSLCADIEPSDGIMFKGLAKVDHINGTLLERLPPPPDMIVVAIIPARRLDTSSYREDTTLLDIARSLRKEHERAYETLKEGLLAHDSGLVARAATLSAEAQQQVIPKDEWSLLKETGSLSGALGIAVAHSGTASGLLFDPSNKFGADLAEKCLRDTFSGFQKTQVTVRRTAVASGGFFAERL